MTTSSSIIIIVIVVSPLHTHSKRRTRRLKAKNIYIIIDIFNNNFTRRQNNKKPELLATICVCCDECDFRLLVLLFSSIATQAAILIAKLFFSLTLCKNNTFSSFIHRSNCCLRQRFRTMMKINNPMERWRASVEVNEATRETPTTRRKMRMKIMSNMSMIRHKQQCCPRTASKKLKSKSKNRLKSKK